MMKEKTVKYSSLAKEKKRKFNMRQAATRIILCKIIFAYTCKFILTVNISPV
jgi:hypothetical protein